MLIFQGFSIYVKFPASLFLILQKKKCVHFWSPVIYLSDIEMFSLFSFEL